MKINNQHSQIIPQNTSFTRLFGKVSKGNPLKSHKESFIKGIHFNTGAPKEDTFVPKIVKTQMLGGHGDPDIKGTFVKNVTIKDSKGKNTKAFIIQEVKDGNCYYLCTDKEALCRMEIREKNSPCGGYIYINALYGQSNDDRYKGAGTELIKFAAQKSRDAGFGGRLQLCMAGSFPFYFKNNFRTGRGYPDHTRKDAYLDYMTRKNLSQDDIYKKDWDGITVILDETGARALLDDKRFFDKSKSETMYSKTFLTNTQDGREFKTAVDVDFSDLSEDEPEEHTYIIQIILRGSEHFYKQIASLEMQLLKDEKGRKYLKTNKLQTDNMGEKFEKSLQEELLKAANIKAKELGAEYISTKNLNIIKAK